MEVQDASGIEDIPICLSISISTALYFSKLSIIRVYKSVPELTTHTHTHTDWNDPIPLASCTPQRAMPELFNMGFHRHSENVRYFHPIKRCEPPQLL